MIRLLLVLHLFILEAYASSQVTLLVSVNGKSGIIFNRKETAQRLIDKFKKHYKGELENLNVISNANQEDLHRELLSPKNKALFWVSHANSSKEESGLISGNVILDMTGNNVKDVFQVINPGIQFVAILGCKTAPIIQSLKQKGYFKHNEDLVFYAREKKINGMKEIKSALEAYEKVGERSPRLCPELQGHSIILTRKIGNLQGKSLKIMNREKFVGLFPAGKPGDMQTLKIHLSSPLKEADLKLMIDSSLEDEISLRSDAFRGEWKVFADQKGRPIGVSQYVYRYSGSLMPEVSLESYEPFICP